MKTKEAIEWLTHALVINNDKADEVIALLKRGEKFEKMWGEVVRYFGYMEWKDEVIEKIKEKYFPNDEVLK